MFECSSALLITQISSSAERYMKIYLVFLFLIIIISASCALIIALFRNNKFKSKANSLLYKKNAELIVAKERAELAARTASEKLKKYTLIRLDNHIKTAVSQYLSFFSNFVQDSKKIEIHMSTIDTEEGLYISFDFPDSVEMETIKGWFDDYMGFLYKEKTDIVINTVEGVSKEESDIIILKLNNQVQNFRRQLEILKVENNSLKSETEFLRDITKIISAKTPQIFISSSSSDSIIKEQNNYSNQSQFIGSSFRNSNLTLTNIDDNIVKLISELSDSKSEKDKLLLALEDIKSEESSEKSKTKSGSLIKKFLESSSSEAAKTLVKYISENGESWLKYIDLI